MFEIDESNRIVNSTANVLFYRKRGSSQVNWDELYQQPFTEYVNAYTTEEEQQHEETNEQQQDNGAVESS